MKQCEINTCLSFIVRFGIDENKDISTKMNVLRSSLTDHTASESDFGMLRDPKDDFRKFNIYHHWSR